MTLHIHSARPGQLRSCQLKDSIWATHGTVLISGTQALVRLMLMQRQRDKDQQWNTRGYISGYRGSPLGMVDQVIWKQGDGLCKAGIEFEPAINEELGATQMLGTQRVESDPERTVDGVFGMWYGKGPGVDRAGDALKHGNAYGSSSHGGVLIVAGDDHGCVSSSMPHQSDQAFQSWHMPVVSPSDVSELISFGLYGFALSRYSGAWVGMTALSEVVESTTTVDLDEIHAETATWKSPQEVQTLTGHQVPHDGLHYRWPDLPSLRIESRLQDKLAAVTAFAQVNSIDHTVVDSPQAQIGIITAGKAHHDLMEVFRRLGLSKEDLAAAGVRILKLGLTFPIEPVRMKAFAQGLMEILVIEEKAPIVEQQLKQLLYNLPSRPVIIGKQDDAGHALLSATGELRPSRLIPQVSHWLQLHLGGKLRIPYLNVRDFMPLEMLSNASDATKRLSYFCAGCPHNTSTKVPQGSIARAGIGCHVMANWMERDTTGLIQMGGEGADWVSHARFTRTPHVFQNLGDGTYYHSGYLAIRQAVAAKTNITYKILFNDAVAMTGGQPVDGAISVDAIARQVESEGVKALAIVSDNIGQYDRLRRNFPAMSSFHPREDLDKVQRCLRETPGVTVLIYEQTCAAEKRRRRKKGELPEPVRHLMVHEDVCEGCGDCGMQSNCVAVVPHETRWGRKRRIDQTHCNKDYSCAQGFCPSFVSVIGGQLKRQAGASPEVRARLLHHARQLAIPHTANAEAPWDLLVTGVGGTGVVTVGAVIAMAAHLEGQQASVLDFMGFSQKGGAVLSFVRIARHPHLLNQVRIDTQQADAVLGCDAVVAASPEALQTIRHGRTRVLINTHETPIADVVRHPDTELRTDLLLEKLRHAAGEDQVETLDAQILAAAVMGHTLGSNFVALGMAWQRGLIPVSWDALEQATRLNKVAVEDNLLCLAIGRLAVASPHTLTALTETPDKTEPDTLESLVDQAADHLRLWQNAAWAKRYRDTVSRVHEQLNALGTTGEALTMSVARSLHKLMSYKDEYEVARLFSSAEFQTQLDSQFEGQYQLSFHMAPPALAFWRKDKTPPSRKITLGGWLLPLMRLLAHGRHLRGTVLDPFGHTHERRMERRLITDYLELLERVLPCASAGNSILVNELLRLPLSMRGFGHIKARNIQSARTAQAWLLHRLSPNRYPRPQGQDGNTLHLRGIAIDKA